MALLLIVVALGLLCLGADWLVRGSASVALRLGLTPLVVGLTVVAYGTSMPELIVSSRAALAGHGDIAIGNAVGSNILNIAIILGLSAVVRPMRVQFQLIKFDTPLMLLVALLFWALFSDFRIMRPEAGLLLLGFALYTAGNLWLARKQATSEVHGQFAAAVPQPSRHWAWDVAWIVGGLIVLALGARLLVHHASVLARAWGVSEGVIGLTIVALGTSMPELATCMVAAVKNQSDIAIGNVVGSNIYNLLAIVGVAGLLRPIEATGIRMFDIHVMVGLSVLVLPLLWTGFTLKRWEGAFLIATYGAYLAIRWPK